MLNKALGSVAQAIYAAVDDEAVRADAFCQRAELRVQLEQWQEHCASIASQSR